MKQLKTKGLGREIVYLDKEDFFKDTPNFKPQNLMTYDNQEEYFEQYQKDGIYIDYIKKLIYAHNIQRSEQRSMREHRKEDFFRNGTIRMHNDIFNDIISKPAVLNDYHNDLFDTYIQNTSFSGRNEGTFKKFKMKIYLYKIMFIYLDKFNEEEVLVNELKLLHRDFYKELNKSY